MINLLLLGYSLDNTKLSDKKIKRETATVSVVMAALIITETNEISSLIRSLPFLEAYKENITEIGNAHLSKFKQYEYK